MKNPVAVFSTVALAAAAALGATLYWKQPSPIATRETPAPLAETPAAAQAEKAPEVAAALATPTPVTVAKAPETAAAPDPAETVVAVATPVPAVKKSAPAEVTPLALPTFDTVRVETSGEAVIAGRAAANALVTVKWNGNVVGTTTANVDGSFVVIPAKPLRSGVGAMTVEMTKDGAVTTSEGSVFVVVKKDAPAMVAKVDSTAPTEVTQIATPAEVPKELQLTAVDYDAAGNIVFSGKAVPGTVVRFYVDNIATGEGKADANGMWRFAGTSAVAPGTHALRADAIDGQGKVVSRIELPFLRESPDVVALAQGATTAPVPVSRSVTETPVAAAPEPAPTEAAPAPVIQPETQVAAAAPVVVEEGPRKLVIQPGNSLWKLSREVYGKGRMYTVIYEANKDLVKNPNRIYPGQILTAPKQN